MRTQNSILTLFAIAFVSGCTTTQEITTRPVEMAFTSPEAKSTVQKYINAPSRTFMFQENRSRVETTGVPCTISGNGFSANYQTPATLRLPIYGMQSSDLTMTCTQNEQSRSTSIGVVNLTARNISNAGSGGGLIGAVVASGISAARGNRPNDNYAYAPANLDLNAKPSR